LLYRSETAEEHKKVYQSRLDNRCSTCGQILPEDKIVELGKHRQEALEKIVELGNTQKATIEEWTKQLDIANQELEKLRTQSRKEQTELIEVEEYKEQRFVEIDEMIANRETIKPEDDEIWNTICNSICEAEKHIGKPVSEQLEEIELVRTNKFNRLANLNKVLAQADRMDKDAIRVVELEEREKELAQLIAGADSQLADISKYEKIESQFVEAAVNTKFQYTTFKLFKELINGSMEPCCEAVLCGVPYSDLSTGQQILVGIDIVNVLSEHYEVSAPLFLDHSESLTLDIKPKGQTIRLFADKNVTELQFEKV